MTKCYQCELSESINLLDALRRRGTSDGNPLNVCPWDSSLRLVEEFVLNGAKQLGKVEWLYKGLPCPKESGRL